MSLKILSTVPSKMISKAKAVPKTPTRKVYLGKRTDRKRERFILETAKRSKMGNQTRNTK